MNKEKSIEQLKKIILSYGLTYEKIEALKMAIEALEQKPPVISDELQQQIKSLKNTCIELSKRATYTEKEKDKYWEFECECGFKGLSVLLLGGNQIADTGEHGNCYCPCCGSIAD